MKLSAYQMEANKIIKGSLSVIIMQLLQNNGRMYGYEIMKAITEAGKGKTKITEAALYAALHRLEAAGFLETESEMAEGRLRKYYKLNRAGKKEASLQLNVLKDSILSLQRILKYKLR